MLCWQLQSNQLCMQEQFHSTIASEWRTHTSRMCFKYLDGQASFLTQRRHYQWCFVSLWKWDHRNDAIVEQPPLDEVVSNALWFLWGTSLQSKSPYVSAFIIYSKKHVCSIAIDCAYTKRATSLSWRGASSSYEIVAWRLESTCQCECLQSVKFVYISCEARFAGTFTA